MRGALAALLLLLLPLAVSAAQDFEAGLAAHARGDFAAALRHWRPLAEAGEARAQNGLGMLLDRGEGVGRDRDQALGWYRRAAAQGHARAQYNLGLKYARGYGVAQDPAAAAAWYAEAAEQGHANAQNNLGALYAQGEGVPRDEVRAYMWWKLAAMQGQEDAIGNLTRLARRVSAEQAAAGRRLAEAWLARNRGSEPAP